MVAALEGIKVLDLSRTLAGPFCTMLLGDMGADVIKVEEPQAGDETRTWTPFWNGESAQFLAFNRNKRSITLNLKDPRAIKICLKLASRSDVLVESFRTGAMERFGLGYNDVSRINPRIVYCSISGYGRTGPLADKPGYDLIIQGYGGMMSVTGDAEGPPMRCGYSMVDLFAGSLAYGAILTALHARERTGKGQYLESSLLEGQVAAMSYHAIAYLATGRVPRPMGSGHPSLTPYQAFRSKDGYFILGVGNDGLWRRFCNALGLHHLMENPRFATNTERVKHRREIVELLSQLFVTRTTREWVELIEEAGVPCGPINDVAAVLSDPQVQHRGMVVSIPHPNVPDLQVPGPPLKLYDTPASVGRYPPLLGEHTQEVLQELGYSEGAIATLRAEGVT